jgi:hypothetical protein
MRIISERTQVHKEAYALTYRWKHDPGAGFSFDCDKNGKIDLENMNPDARRNYDKCRNGTYEVEFVGITDYSWDYWEPKIGECVCGKHITLDGFTNACECGRDYNSSGTLLAPRSQWGEETGEHLSDILRIP